MLTRVAALTPAVCVFVKIERISQDPDPTDAEWLLPGPRAGPLIVVVSSSSQWLRDTNSRPTGKELRNASNGKAGHHEHACPAIVGSAPLYLPHLGFGAVRSAARAAVATLGTFHAEWRIDRAGTAVDARA